MTEQEQDDATREGVQDSSRQERAPGVGHAAGGESTGAPGSGGPPRVSARSRRVTGALVRFLRLFADMVTPTNVAVLAGLVVIGVTGILGGWRAIEEQPQDVPVVADGETVRTGPFDITVREAMWAQDPGAFGLPDQGDALLVLRATVENTHGSWVDAYVLADALSGSLSGVDLVPQSGLFANSRATDGGIGTPTLRRAVDLQYASTVQPGFSQDYWFVWELPPDTQRASQLDLTFHSQTWRASSLDGHHFWTDRVLIGHQEIVVDTDGEVS